MLDSRSAPGQDFHPFLIVCQTKYWPCLDRPHWDPQDPPSGYFSPWALHTHGIHIYRQNIHTQNSSTKSWSDPETVLSLAWPASFHRRSGHTCNLSFKEVGAGGSVQDQAGLHEVLFQTNKQKTRLAASLDCCMPRMKTGNSAHSSQGCLFLGHPHFDVWLPTASTKTSFSLLPGAA